MFLTFVPNKRWTKVIFLKKNLKKEHGIDIAKGTANHDSVLPPNANGLMAV